MRPACPPARAWRGCSLRCRRASCCNVASHDAESAPRPVERSTKLSAQERTKHAFEMALEFVLLDVRCVRRATTRVQYARSGFVERTWKRHAVALTRDDFAKPQLPSPASVVRHSRPKPLSSRQRAK